MSLIRETVAYSFQSDNPVMRNEQKLIIAAFFDGRPGHEKQTLGIIESLKTKTEIEVISVKVGKKTVLRFLLDWSYYIFSTKSQVETSLSNCNLIIGTGTHTHLPMLLLKKKIFAPAVTCMTPAAPLQNRFDLIFAPQHDLIKEGGNVLKTIGPPNPNRDIGCHKSDRVLVLCGGADPKSHTWDSDEIVKNIEMLVTYKPERKYIISSSPRTPEETAAKLISLTNRSNNLEFYHFRDTPSGWVEKEYSQCEQVWVTGDSISMVYEALSSGCRVGIIPVRWKSMKSKFVRSERYLKQASLIVELNAYLQGEHNWKKHATLNEADRCASEILKRLL